MEVHVEIRTIHFEATWDLRHKVMWPDQSLDYVKLPNDEHGLHYGLFANDKLTAVVSVFIVDNEAQFRKLATLDDEQGKGYGTQLLNYLFLELAKDDITKVWCNARVDKTNFYQRFGMVKTERRFDKTGISYVIMEKTI
jgi:predicted GNAT family N-acyltransferase